MENILANQLRKDAEQSRRKIIDQFISYTTSECINAAKKRSTLGHFNCEYHSTLLPRVIMVTNPSETNREYSLECVKNTIKESLSSSGFNKPKIQSEMTSDYTSPEYHNRRFIITCSW